LAKVFSHFRESKYQSERKRFLELVPLLIANPRNEKLKINIKGGIEGGFRNTK